MTAITESEMLAFVAVIATVLLFAVVSNVLVIVSVTSFRKLRTVTNVLIGNLAVSDILLDGIYMPQKLHDLRHTDNYHEDVIMCKFIHFIPILLITSICYTLVAISFERRRAIVYSHKRQVTLTHIRKVIAAIWIFSVIMCKFVHFIPILLITSSCYTLVAISFERRRAIVYSHKRQVTLTHIRKVIAAIWILSFIVSLPTLFEFSLEETYLKTEVNVTSDNVTGVDVTAVTIQCGHAHTTYSFVLADGIFVLVVSFLIPLVLVCYNYIRLARFIAKRGRKVCDIGTVSGKVIAQGQVQGPAKRLHQGQPQGQVKVQLQVQVQCPGPVQGPTHWQGQGQVQVQGIGQVQSLGLGQARRVPQLCRYRTRLIKMLVLVAAMFAFSWTPFFAIFIYMKISEIDASQYDGSAAGLLLIAMATFSTAYNAVLYVVFNSNFREAFKSIMKCSWKDIPGRTSTMIG